MEDKTFVTHTCRNCGQAFMDIDELNAFLYPPDYKNCPECVKNGFKNPKEAREEYKPIARFQEYIYKWQEESNQSKEDTEFIFNKALEILNDYKQFGKKINTLSIFNQAKEILGYYKEEKLALENY